MKFVEETGGQWAADKLRLAEADFEQQKREWEANRQAAQRKAEEEAEQQRQMDEEDDYPLTYSSEDAKNQVKAKSIHSSSSRTVVVDKGAKGSVVGGKRVSSRQSQLASSSSSPPVGNSTLNNSNGGKRLTTSSGRVINAPPPSTSSPVVKREDNISNNSNNSKRSRLSNNNTTNSNHLNNNNSRTSSATLTKAVPLSNSNNSKSPTRSTANSNRRSGTPLVNGMDGKKMSSFASPAISAGKQMPRAGGSKVMDTSTPIRKVLRARYTSLTASESDSVVEGSQVVVKSNKGGRSSSRQRTVGTVVENGDHQHYHHKNREDDQVINCEDDSNSECSMDVMVDSNDATDSNRTNNDNDSVHSVTSNKQDEEGNTSATTPRTRSRGSVKINLWTLDESPMLPVARVIKPSRLATDSLNASSLVGVGESSGEDGEEDEDNRSLEEIRRRSKDKSKTPVNGSGGSPTSRKRKGASVQREAVESSAEDCKRLTRRASVVVGAGTNGPVPVSVNTP